MVLNTITITYFFGLGEYYTQEMKNCIFVLIESDIKSSVNGMYIIHQCVLYTTNYDIANNLLFAYGCNGFDMN